MFRRFRRSHLPARLGAVLVAGTACLVGAPAHAAPAAGAEPPRTALDALSARLGGDRAEAARRLDAQPAQAATADGLVTALGPARTAGAYLAAADGRLVVTVTDRAAAATVAATGTASRLVRYSGTRLAEIRARLLPAAPVDTRAGIDPTTDRLVLDVPGTADARLRGRADAWPDAVRVTDDRTPSSGTESLAGGQRIETGRWICSIGFLARRGAARYALTAGHCTDGMPVWTRAGRRLGATSASRFPGADYGAIRIADPAAWQPRPVVGDHGATRRIVGAGSVPVGGTVCKTGQSTGTTCGTVTQLDVTVRYAEGAVYGLIGTDVCTGNGDSGGPLYTGGTAVGLVSGGLDRPCGAGYESFFQPVRAALAGLGLSLL